MPKSVNYTKGSVIYFAGDTDDRVFILQKGNAVATNDDVETKLPVTEQIKNGEFFGVKSALGHFPREETVTTLEDSTCISMTVQEFEKIFSSNKQIIMKMLRVFSKQLRQIHSKTEAILNRGEEINQISGLFSVAQAFYNDEKWRSCADVCLTFLKHYSTSPYAKDVAEMYAKANAYVKKGISSSNPASENSSSSSDETSGIFDLPAFQRFQKTYQDGQVIITEFENGETFYLIQSGTVQLTKCANDTNKNLDILKPGEFFGEMAILDNSPRSATCVAMGEVKCLEFNKENFELLIGGNPQLAIILLKLFCKRIYDQKRRFKILVIADPQARLADVFCMLDEMNPSGKPPADHSRTFNVTMSDLAHWSGFPLDVVKNEINKFSASRKVEVYDDRMVVANILDMKRIVDTKANQRKA